MQRTTACLILGVFLVSASALRAGDGGYEARFFSPKPKPIYNAGLGYSAAEFEGYGDSSLTELSLDWEFANFRRTWAGDVDLTLDVEAALFADSAGMHLPDQLVALAVDLGWARFSRNGIGARFRLAPGIYSDFQRFEGRALSAPLSGVLTCAFGPSVSGVVGAEVRPNFERLVRPIAGLAVQAGRATRLVVGVPEGSLSHRFGPRFESYIAYAWRDQTFGLRDDRRAITLEDYSACLGIRLRQPGGAAIVVEVGSVFDRSVEFDRTRDEHDPSEAVDADDSLYIRLAFVGSD
jgi:hypothetical protein